MLNLIIFTITHVLLIKGSYNNCALDFITKFWQLCKWHMNIVLQVTLFIMFNNYRDSCERETLKSDIRGIDASITDNQCEYLLNRVYPEPDSKLPMATIFQRLNCCNISITSLTSSLSPLSTQNISS